MGHIVSYKKDALGPRCHMKLESGERILIHSEVSTNQHATDPLWMTVSTLKLGGLLPGPQLFRFDQRSDAGKKIIASLPAMKAEGAKPAPVDALVDFLKAAGSVAEAKASLEKLGLPDA
ncbi:MAG TPA: hypothetical protein PLB01_06890 [Thermoanaerobaculia bacterium]|nr:hypothetical protein [Thermoanaerobaculia bacterium]